MGQTLIFGSSEGGGGGPKKLPHCTHKGILRCNSQKMSKSHEQRPEMLENIQKVAKIISKDLLKCLKCLKIYKNHDAYR